jgi:hypothetical protein
MVNRAYLRSIWMQMITDRQLGWADSEVHFVWRAGLELIVDECSVVILIILSGIKLISTEEIVLASGRNMALLPIQCVTVWCYTEQAGSHLTGQSMARQMHAGGNALLSLLKDRHVRRIFAHTCFCY